MNRAIAIGVHKIRERFNLPMLTAPHPSAEQWTTCPVCGRSWKPWSASRLPCHAACLIPPPEQDALLAALDRPERPTVKEMADALGVPRTTLAANLHAASKRAGGNLFARR